MVYKWSTETFRKTETLSNGESHDYSGERYWIDVVALDGIKIDVVLKSTSCDHGPYVVTGKFRVNGIVVKEWDAPTLQEAAAVGEALISSLQECTKNIV